MESNMSEEDRKALRKFYEKEYYLKTGIKLVVVESKGQKRDRKVRCKKNILQITSEYYNIPIEDILKDSRKPDIVQIRRFIMKVMSMYRVESTQIGKLLNKDHTTVLHSIETHNGICQVDKDYKNLYQQYIKHCDSILLKVKKQSVTKEVVKQIKEDRDTMSLRNLAIKYNLDRRTITRILSNTYKTKKLK